MPLSPENDHYNRILQFEQSQRRRLGRPRLVQYLINRRYYYGDNNQPDDVNQPLGIRYIPKIVNKNVHYLFGEWESDILNWQVSPLDKSKDSEYKVADEITRTIYKLMRRTQADEVIMRAALDGGIYGDSVFKLKYSKDIAGSALESVLPEYFHAMWHPLNVGETTEALVSYNLDRQTAYQLFGTVGNERYFQPLSFLDPGSAIVWEHWTPYQYELVVDDQMISQGPNPYIPLPTDTASIQGNYIQTSTMPGWIPFIHIPNLSVNGEYFGFGDAEPVLELQDELNMRIADFGDMINYHAHPITTVQNYFGRLDDLRSGPDIVWDLGREGKAEYLEWSGTPPGTMDYLNLLMTIMFDTTSLPAVAFGRSEQSQASGSSLVAQMLPIVEVVRRKRATWSPKLRQLATRLLQLESMSMSSAQFVSTYNFSPQDLERFEISPKWAPIMPRDRLQVVNENVALLVNKARSIITALEDLGVDDPEEERDRIIQDVKEFLQIDADIQKQTMENEAEINKDLAQFEADINDDQATQQTTPGIDPNILKQSQQEHDQTMEQMTTQHENTMQETQAKTDQVQAKSAADIAVLRVKAQTQKKPASSINRSGGKNSDSASGKSNTDS